MAINVVMIDVGKLKMTSFTEFSLDKSITKAIAEKGYRTPTPIQKKSIPYLIEGRDLLGCAQTGTGKTAAFALPILHRLSLLPEKKDKRSIRALILSPTRELASQINESFRHYGKYLPFKTAAVFGGVNRKQQERILNRGIDILVATPGRLLDLMSTGHVLLRALNVFVLDEADRMLDMGFIHDVRKIIKALPEKRQSLFFSATMPKPVIKLADSMLDNPMRVAIVPQATPAERIKQSVVFVDKSKKDSLLQSILKDKELERVLIFTRTKHRANRVVAKLLQLEIPADAIHGNKAQNARANALKSFRNGKLRVLVATDIASRGIDVSGITHVINYEIPNEPESYVHRIGRTARAGNAGVAISFCSGDERNYLSDIEKAMRFSIDVTRDVPYYSKQAEFGLVNSEEGTKAKKRNTPGQNSKRYADQLAKKEAKKSPHAKRNARGNPKRQNHNKKGKMTIEKKDFKRNSSSKNNQKLYGSELPDKG